MQRRCSNCQSFSVCDIDDHGLVLHEDAQDLKLAAGGGGHAPSCDLCSIIWWSLRQDWRKRPLNRGRGEFIAGDFEVRIYRNPPRSAGPIQRIDILVMPPGGGQDFLWVPAEHGLWHVGPPDEKPWIVRSHLIVYSKADCTEDERSSPLADICYSLPAEHSGADQCLDLASRWLTACVESHGSTCSENEDAVLPKRVVDVGSDCPHLFTTEGRRGRYMTLSYCWGVTAFFRLTSDNIDELHTSLPMEELPRTIRDAVSLAKRLDIRYLWVDCLCIIQGDDLQAISDWEEQSRDMGNIYGSALITVAAAAAEDCYKGFFNDRPVPQIPYCPVRKTHANEQIVYLGQDLPVARDQVEPLSRRGWAFQESVLSRRLLTFGTSELSWKCNYCSRRETVLQSLPKDTASSSVVGTAAGLLLSWAVVVEEYSARDLSFITDRLPAINGLAQVVSQAAGGEYHFGIWKHRASEMLMWRHLGRIQDDKLVFSRQKTVRAPTWSWASVDGGIRLLKGAVGPERLDIRGRCLIITGLMKKVDTIRYQAEGRYYGGYENYTPWMNFRESVRTYVDDLDEIPLSNRKTKDNGIMELVDSWFFFLGKAQGLILLPINANDTVNRLRNSGKTKAGRVKSFFHWETSGRAKNEPVGRFRRVGAFVGHSDSGDIQTIELI